MEDHTKLDLINKIEKLIGIKSKNISNVDNEKSLQKIWNEIKNTSDMGLVGLIQILTLLSTPIPLVAGATGLSVVSYFWGKEQQRKFLIELEEQINLLGTDIKHIKISFDEFMEEFTGFIEIASKSASEEKRKYLVNAFINSIAPSNIPFSGKQTLRRILSQISVEEIQILKIISDFEIEMINQGKFPCVDINRISEKLNWDKQNTLITCEALCQLMLISDASVGQFNSLEYHHQIWRITSLGAKFIQWCTQDCSN